MIDRTYRCNLCREQHELRDMIGLHWSSWPKGWAEKPPRETENHLCMKCLSTLQALPPRCGGGFECTGGPNCGSDHK
ncbi:hypothetical protein D3C76_134730 [compost metagenome]